VPDRIKGLAHIQEHRRAVFLIVYGLENGVSYTVALLNCGVGSAKSKMVVRYPVAGCEVRISSAGNQFFKIVLRLLVIGL